jgi:hypothetical protein
MPRRPSSSAAAPAAEPVWRRLLRALGGVLRLLFVRQLRLRRVDGRLAMALEDKPRADAAERAAANADTRPQDLTFGELSTLLDAAPNSRSSLRYLAALEHGLKRKDPTGLFLFEVEPARLQAALRQLDSLAPQPTAGLAALRARIVDASGAQQQRQQQLEMLMPRSDLMQGHKVEVAEARVSDFDRVAEQWRGKDAAS